MNYISLCRSPIPSRPSVTMRTTTGPPVSSRLQRSGKTRNVVFLTLLLTTQEHPRDQEPLGDPLRQGDNCGLHALQPGGGHGPLGCPRGEGGDQGREASPPAPESDGGRGRGHPGGSSQGGGG